MSETAADHSRDLAQTWLALLDGSLAFGETVELPMLSDSMMPLFGNGRRIRIKRAAWKSCHVGDIVVFSEGRRLTAHRLLFSVRFGRRAYLFQKGDANPGGHFIRSHRVVGRVIGYQDDEGRYRALDSKLARCGARREARRQLLRSLRGCTIRLFGVRNERS